MNSLTKLICITYLDLLRLRRIYPSCPRRCCRPRGPAAKRPAVAHAHPGGRRTQAAQKTQPRTSCLKTISACAFRRRWIASSNRSWRSAGMKTLCLRRVLTRSDYRVFQLCSMLQ